MRAIPRPPLFLFLALLLLAACKPGREAKAPEGRALTLPTLTVEERRASECRCFPGQVEARNSITLAGKTAGSVVEVRFNEGDLVKKGDLILQIDDSDLRQRQTGLAFTVSQAQRESESLAARAGLARVKLERMAKLLKQGAVSQDDYDRARAEYDSLRKEQEAVSERGRAVASQKDEVRTLQSYSRITAPFDGVLVRRHVDIGAFVAAGQPLALVDDVKSGYDFTARVDEGLMPKVSRGLPVLASIPSFRPEPFLTRVSALVANVDPATRTFLVKLALPEGPGLHAGLFGRVLIPVAETGKILLPKSLIRFRGDLPSVFVVDADGVIRFRVVKLGASYFLAEVEGRSYLLNMMYSPPDQDPGQFDLVEVVSGLFAGEVIVSDATQTLREGDRLVR